MRIKKKYLVAIALGEKNNEYRSVKKFYNYLTNPDLKYLVFHYQDSVRLKVEVKSVTVIDTPQRLRENKDINFADQVYDIQLGERHFI